MKNYKNNVSIMVKQPLLSVCIPTYNRSTFLQEALRNLLDNQKTCEFCVEILISDNCSTDETGSVVETYISKGLKCRYVHNEENIGPDANFVQCFNLAKGKYIWLIGDDDYLEPGALQIVCESLENYEYGLVHIKLSNNEVLRTEYNKVSNFLSDINIMITFMSANIINRTVVSSIKGQDYFGTFLVQVPYYIGAALAYTRNLILEANVLSTGHNSAANGGYNFFTVFMVNYFSIWREFIKKGYLSPKDYEYIKKETFERFHLNYIYRHLIGQPNQALDMSGCIKTTLRYFGMNLYLYTNLLRKCGNYYWMLLRHKVHMVRMKTMYKIK